MPNIPHRTYRIFAFSMWSFINVLYVKSCFMNPGFVKKRHASEETLKNMIICDKCPKQKGKMENCKPARTHHCKICKTCFTKFDHHCHVIMNCVALNNHSFYLLLLFTVFFCLFIVFVEEVVYVYLFVIDYLRALSYVEMIIRGWLYGVVMFSTAGGYGATIALFGVHIRYMVLNITTLEEKKQSDNSFNQFDMGVLANIKFNCGIFWKQLLPMETTFKHEGYFYPTINDDFYTKIPELENSQTSFLMKGLTIDSAINFIEINNQKR